MLRRLSGSIEKILNIKSEKEKKRKLVEESCAQDRENFTEDDEDNNKVKRPSVQRH